MARPKGVYCPHGEQIMVPERTDPEQQYPGFVFAEPYPCSESACAQERVIEDFEAERRQYEDDRWAEYRNLIGA